MTDGRTDRHTDKHDMTAQAALMHSIMWQKLASCDMNGWLTCRYAGLVSAPASELTSSLTQVENRRRSEREDHVRLTCTHAERGNEKVPRHSDSDFLRLVQCDHHHYHYHHHHITVIFINDKDLQNISDEYFTISCMREISKSVDNHNITNSVK